MTRRADRLRPAGSDDLGLRRALSDRLLPMLVGAMAFLAALAMAGLVGAAALARHWQAGAGSTLTVQVPEPERDNRQGRVLALLRASPGMEARALTTQELETLLRPWLGSGEGRIALPIPGVIEVRLVTPALDPAIASRLQAEAPGTMIEANDVWVGRLATLARSLQALATLAMAVVGFVAVAVVMVATRAGLAARREAIDIVHGLGATDGFIAGRFARRTTTLAGLGAVFGSVLALPVLLGLTGLAAPFAGADPPEGARALLAAMPGPLWLGIPALPPIAAAIGWVTAQWTVRRWLRRLP